MVSVTRQCYFKCVILNRYDQYSMLSTNICLNFFFHVQRYLNHVRSIWAKNLYFWEKNCSCSQIPLYLSLYHDETVFWNNEESWISKCQRKMTTFASVTSIRSVDSYFIHLLAESPSLHVQPPPQRGLKWYFEKQSKRHAVQWELNSLSILLQGPNYITGRQHILAKTLVF